MSDSIGAVTAFGFSTIVANRPTDERALSSASTDSGSSSLSDADDAAGARRGRSSGWDFASVLSGWSAIHGASSRASSSSPAVVGSGSQLRGRVARSWAASAGFESAWRAITAVCASVSWSAAAVSRVRARRSLSWSSATRAVAFPAEVSTVVTASGVDVDDGSTGESAPSSLLRAMTSERPERTAAVYVVLSGDPVAGHARPSFQACRRSVSVSDVPQRAVVTAADPRGMSWPACASAATSASNAGRTYVSRALAAAQTSRAQPAEALDREAEATSAGSATQVTPSAPAVASTTWARRPDVAASSAAVDALDAPAAVASVDVSSAPASLSASPPPADVASGSAGSTAGPVRGTAIDRFTGVTVSDDAASPSAPTGYQRRKERRTASRGAVVGDELSPSVTVTASGRGPQTAVRPMVSAFAVTLACQVPPGASSSGASALARTVPTASSGAASTHVSRSVRVDGRIRLRERDTCGSAIVFFVPLCTSTVTVTSSPGRVIRGLRLTRVAVTVFLAAVAAGVVTCAGAATAAAASPVPASRVASTPTRTTFAVVRAIGPGAACRRLMRRTRGAS